MSSHEPERSRRNLFDYLGSPLAVERIDVLEIPDDFEVMDPVLIEALRLMLDPEIELLAAHDAEEG